MKLILLQYPDATPDSRIVNDLTELSRGTGNRGQRATSAFSDGSLPGLRTKLAQRSIPLSTQAFAALASTQAVVSHGVAIPVTGGTVTFTVVGNAITGGAFTPT